MAAKALRCPILGVPALARADSISLRALWGTKAPRERLNRLAQRRQHRRVPAAPSEWNRSERDERAREGDAPHVIVAAEPRFDPLRASWVPRHDDHLPYWDRIACQGALLKQ
jgi:hypothetical protein